MYVTYLATRWRNLYVINSCSCSCSCSLKVTGELFRPNFVLGLPDHGRSVKSGPKFDISNCNRPISGIAGPILKNEIDLQSSQQDLSNGTS